MILSLPASTAPALTVLLGVSRQPMTRVFEAGMISTSICPRSLLTSAGRWNEIVQIRVVVSVSADGKVEETGQPKVQP